MSIDNVINSLDELIIKISSQNFDKFNSTRFTSIIPKKCLGESCILGVDEAGRGPVLGPMVYAICYCSAKEQEVLKSIGCTDSKTLTEKKREDIFGLINENRDAIGWAVEVISPNFISNRMLQKVKYSLNEIAQNSTIKLIEFICENNLKISEIYVDTIGPPDKYQAKLLKVFPECKVKVEKKADSLFPIVGAASICAKVIRDAVIQNWKFLEDLKISDNDFGTGYPNDPKTKQFLLENMDDIFGFPHLVRFSWSTAEKLLEKITPVEWEEEEEAKKPEGKNISSFFDSLGPSKKKKHKTRFSFFKERSLNSFEGF